MPAWESAIDRRLAARLVRPLQRPGVIRLTLARRILAGVAALSDRLPLLGRFGGRRELAASAPIVHARWLAPAPVEPASTPSARPIVRAAPAQVIERTIERAGIAAQRPPASALEGAVRSELPRPAVSASDAAAPVRAAEPAGPARGAAAPELIAAATPASGVALRGRDAASGPGAVDPAGTSPPGVRGVVEDRAVRRSRVGAPLPPQRPVASRLAGEPATDPRAITRPDAPAPVPTTAAGLIAAPIAPPVAPPAALTAPVGPASGRAGAPPGGDARSGDPGAVPRVKPRAVVVDPRAGSATRSATPIVVPDPPRAQPTIPGSPIQPLPAVVPVVRPARPVTGNHPLPIVQPERTSVGERARTTPLTLANPPAAPPAITAARAVEPAPIASAVPRPVVQPAAPPAPALRAIDVHQLADQVQRILLRQAEHARARQGLPR